MSESSERSSCLYLAFGDDRGLYCLFPNQIHRCYRSGAAKPIPWDLQERFCLGEGHAACPTFQGGAPAEPKRTGRLGYAALCAGAVFVALALLAQATGALGGTAPPIGAAGTASGAATALSGEAPASFRAAPSGDGPGSGTPMPAVQSPPSIPGPPSIPAPPAVPAPLSSSPVSAAPQAAIAQENPPSSPTPSMPAGEGPQRTHVVASGETVTSIAQRYRSTVEAIVRANRLADKNLILTGQRLIIP